MNTETIQKHFQKMGADFKVTGPLAFQSGGYAFDVNDGKFTISIRGDQSQYGFNILDIDPDGKHILMSVVLPGRDRSNRELKEKWLCGHDERDWFIAAISNETGVKNIHDAKESLKPEAVLLAEANLKSKHKQKRRNKARIRQGEWFFIPSPELVIPENGVTHKDEPISRGAGSKPHIVEEIYRTGGKPVWVLHDKIVSETEYTWLKDELRKQCSRRMVDAVVYGKGYVRHQDHETIYLEGWHRILMNREGRKKSLLFID